jgi:hypothetical protein
MFALKKLIPWSLRGTQSYIPYHTHYHRWVTHRRYQPNPLAHGIVAQLGKELMWEDHRHQSKSLLDQGQPLQILHSACSAQLWPNIQ